MNVVALAANAGFVGPHALRTHVCHDGLARDVSIFGPQGSVVLQRSLVFSTAHTNHWWTVSLAGASPEPAALLRGPPRQPSGPTPPAS